MKEIGKDNVTETKKRSVLEKLRKEEEYRVETRHCPCSRMDTYYYAAGLKYEQTKSEKQMDNQLV